MSTIAKRMNQSPARGTFTVHFHTNGRKGDASGWIDIARVLPHQRDYVKALVDGWNKQLTVRPAGLGTTYHHRLRLDGAVIGARCSAPLPRQRRLNRKQTHRQLLQQVMAELERLAYVAQASFDESAAQGWPLVEPLAPMFAPDARRA